jgi:hypothetical protein
MHARADCSGGRAEAMKKIGVIITQDDEGDCTVLSIIEARYLETETTTKEYFVFGDARMPNAAYPAFENELRIKSRTRPADAKLLQEWLKIETDHERDAFMMMYRAFEDIRQNYKIGPKETK